MEHMVNWNKVHELNGEIAPKDAHGIYMYHNLLYMNDVFLAVKGYEGILLPIDMYPMKLIPLYL
jgi:hypothetical protein